VSRKSIDTVNLFLKKMVGIFTLDVSLPEIIYPSEEHGKKSEIGLVMEMGIYVRQCLDSTVCVGKYMFFECFSRLHLAILIYQNR